MTDTTHTPGPWLVADTTVYSLQSDGHVLVNRFSAHVQTGIGRDAQRTPLAELEANARLMAASPDLLAALRDALVVIDDYLAYEHDGDPNEEDARLMGEMDINDYARDGRLAAARAAIARATGAAA